MTTFRIALNALGQGGSAPRSSFRSLEMNNLCTVCPGLINRALGTPPKGHDCTCVIKNETGFADAVSLVEVYMQSAGLRGGGGAISSRSL